MFNAKETEIEMRTERDGKGAKEITEKVRKYIFTGRTISRD